MESGADRSQAYSVLDGRLDEFVRILSDYARVPTISAHGTMFREGAEATREILEDVGAKVRLLASGDGPANVIGEMEEDRRLPWLILYNHYDVQPVDPLDEWNSDPFDPVVRDGKLFGRGVADTKGNTVAQALAVDAVRDVMGRLPVNVRFFIDGEEESGSPHMPAFSEAHPDLFRGLGATIEGAAQTREAHPVLTLGSKGVLGVELEVRTARSDQHSSLAVLVPNAAWRLLSALRTLRSEDGRVLIDGFYDGVPQPEPDMLHYLRRNSVDLRAFQDLYGVPTLLRKGSKFQLLKHAVYSPTCTINGIWSGYTGPGAKTVNPAVARAKLDFRLLPGQRPDDVFDKLVAHFRGKGFDDVTVTKDSGVFEPASTRLTERIVQEALAATRDVFRVEPDVFPWSFASSTTWYFTRAGTPSISLPAVGYAGSLAHAPNEHIRLEDARRATKTAAALLMFLGPSS